MRGPWKATLILCAHWLVWVRLASGSEDLTIKIWNTQTGNCEGTWKATLMVCPQWLSGGQARLSVR